MVKAPTQGEIIKINLDPKKGHEQAGYRPYLCLSNEKISSISNVAIFAPVSNTKRIYPFYCSLNTLEKVPKTTGKVLLDQLVTIDYNARDFVRVETLGKADMKKILALVKLVFEEN